jgi:sugar lactone lactonase YvrE
MKFYKILFFLIILSLYSGCGGGTTVTGPSNPTPGGIPSVTPSGASKICYVYLPVESLKNPVAQLGLIVSFDSTVPSGYMPVAQVDVYVDNSSSSMETDSSGRFLLSNLSIGFHIIRLKYLSYQSAEYAVIVSVENTLNKIPVANFKIVPQNNLTLYLQGEFVSYQLDTYADNIFGNIIHPQTSWTVDDSTNAFILDNGMFFARKTGTYNITAAAKDDETLFDKLTIRVENKIITVTGTVKDGNDNPVSGAYVSCCNQFTVTDVSGNYKLYVPYDYIITLTATTLDGGYGTAEISVGDNDFTVELDILLAYPAYDYVFVTKWGGTGSGDSQFSEPHGITSDSSGNLYIADSLNHRIEKFTSSGSFVNKWGSLGTGNKEFNYPWDVAADYNNNIYVSDSSNHRIEKFTSKGDYLGKWGTEGNGDGQLYYPKGLAFDKSGNIYITDNNHRVQKFTSSGTFIKKWGGQGSSDGQFEGPDGIVIDGSGYIYVADGANNRVQKFDSNGKFITKWGGSGTGDGQFKYPLDVSADSYGNIYTTDKDNGRVQKFSSTGIFIAKWGSPGTDDGKFNEPSGITVDSAGNVYVCDSKNNIVQIFAPK